MRKAIIAASIGEKHFRSEFWIQQETPEYKIADEAWRVGLLFAHTQALAKYGRPLTSYEFGKFLENLDYNYEIREENN